MVNNMGTTNVTKWIIKANIDKCLFEIRNMLYITLGTTLSNHLNKDDINQILNLCNACESFLNNSLTLKGLIEIKLQILDYFTISNMLYYELELKYLKYMFDFLIDSIGDLEILEHSRKEGL